MKMGSISIGEVTVRNHRGGRVIGSMSCTSLSDKGLLTGISDTKLMAGLGVSLLAPCVEGDFTAVVKSAKSYRGVVWTELLITKWWS